MNGNWKDGVFQWPVRVYYEDTDAGGVVYNANYLAYAERARTESLRSLGFEQQKLAEQDTIFVVRETNIKYIKPAKLDDLLTVSVSMLDQRPVSATFGQRITRGAELIADLQIQVVCISRAGRPKRIPEIIIEKFNLVGKDA